LKFGLALSVTRNKSAVGCEKHSYNELYKKGYVYTTGAKSSKVDYLLKKERNWLQYRARDRN